MITYRKNLCVHCFIHMVTRNYVEDHVKIGIEALRMIIDEKKTVRHLKFDW